MFKFILPTILIGSSIAGFFVFTSPFYKDISLKREQIKSYNEALDNSKALEAERDKLTQKYNSIEPENLSKLQKLLPDNVDNIRLILEIEKIALPYGMVLKDVKYNATDKENTESQTAGIVQSEGVAQPKNYGVLGLEFSTQGTYSNFINFLKDLENNLRIVDISSIQFSSNASVGTNKSLPEAYKYNFKIKTYWLKN
ncbi:MAG: hypothetical protein WC822_02815 [Candidatus Paceibacterota bacterium]|jgi:Tfp pilus assembly protein PilO